MYIEHPIQPGLSAYTPDYPPVERFITIENAVPFATAGYWRWQFEPIPLDQLAKNTRYTLPFLAWETVRKTRNPFFVEGTGLEGFLVGCATCPEQALDTILKLCQQTLTALTRRYQFQPQFRTRLMQTLIGESSHHQAIHIWSIYLAIMLARLRCNLLDNRAAILFRVETYQFVNSYPTIQFTSRDHRLQQRYSLGCDYASNSAKIDLNLVSIPARDRDALVVARQIGQFGHPIVRQLIDR